MKKILIYSIGRCGSTFYALQLRKTIDFLDQDICWHADNKDIDWSLPIHHTHNFTMLKEAPSDFIRVHATRSILDCAVSKFIAEFTGSYHIFSEADREKYLSEFQNKKFKIDVKHFVFYVLGIYNEFVEAQKLFNEFNGEKYMLYYDVHAHDTILMFQTLKLSIDSNFQVIGNPIQVFPIDKFCLIENLDEMLDAYKSLRFEFDQYDLNTISKVEKILENKN